MGGSFVAFGIYPATPGSLDACQCHSKCPATPGKLGCVPMPLETSITSSQGIGGFGTVSSGRCTMKKLLDLNMKQWFQSI
ncbi:hypothetical protein OIU76_001159, partial [Salix suchowensis]